MEMEKEWDRGEEGREGGVERGNGVSEKGGEGENGSEGLRDKAERSRDTRERE